MNNWQIRCPACQILNSTKAFQTRQFQKKDFMNDYKSEYNLQQGHQMHFLKQKLHQYMIQNYYLRQAVSEYKTKLTVGQQEKERINQLLKFSLEQLQKYDHQFKITIENANKLNQKVIYYQKILQNTIIQLKQAHTIIEQLKQHQYNLNIQNQMLIQIKQKNCSDLKQYKSQVQVKNQQIQQFHCRIQKKNCQIKHLCFKIKQLQCIINDKKIQIQGKTNQIVHYQHFLQNKNQQLQNKKLNYLGLQNIQIQKLLNKLEKSKAKAWRYKRQRDQLYFEIQKAKEQIGTIKLIKYIQQT